MKNKYIDKINKIIALMHKLILLKNKGSAKSRVMHGFYLLKDRELYPFDHFFSLVVKKIKE
jgi:hypothetical protein